ncbi:MAG: biotin/lipoyl-binding protein [Clostridium sp.]|nr:biotin/lipoyl-binding protein [Clostridium sp.]MDU7085526.1 biotin/lipoyl-binding protein [Clostridium sp.]
MKTKRIVSIVLAAVIAVGICGGGIWLYRKNSDSSKKVEVTPVSSLTGGWWGNEMYTGGIVSNDLMQEIYLEEQQKVKEVFVTEGQEVNVGDKLFEYDKTLIELDMETQNLEMQQADRDIAVASEELKVLKNTTPIVKKLPKLVEVEETQKGPASLPIVGKDGAANKADGSSKEGTDGENSGENEETPQPPKVEATLYSNIRSDAKAYKGTGAADDPYRFLCSSEVTISGEFINKLIGYNAAGTSKEGEPTVAVFEIHKGNVVEGDMLYLWTMYGSDYEPVAADSVWKFGVNSDEKPVEPEPPVEPPVEEGYTKEELAKLIAEKEEKIRDLQLKKKKSQLNYDNTKAKLDKCTVVSTVKGKVSSLKTQEELTVGTPFMIVSGGDAFYVTGSISELLLGQLKVGDALMANLWSPEGQKTYNAVISEISEYPASNGNNYGSGNMNVSYYPFTAVIEESEGLTNGQYLDMTMTVGGNTDGTSNALYLSKAYIREENGKNYVFIANEDNRLEKRYIETGKIIYGEQVEVKEGVTMEDRIAFPYGKNVKEGVRVKDMSEEGGMFFK